MITYKEHLDFVMMVSSARWFKTFEAFHKSFASHDEKLLIKAWKKAKGVK